MPDEIDDELARLLGHTPDEHLAPTIRSNVDINQTIADGLEMLAARWDGPGTDDDKAYFANLEIHTDPETGVVNRGTAFQQDCKHAHQTEVFMPEENTYDRLCLDCGFVCDTRKGGE